MKAANLFRNELPPETDAIKVELFGSLALTGEGHGTDRAILLGLAGYQPDTLDPDTPTPQPNNVTLTFHRDLVLPGHSNGMRFTALRHNQPILTRIYYSIGGGFVTGENPHQPPPTRPTVPYPFSNGEELLHHDLAIWEVMLRNEEAWRPREEVLDGIHRIWQTMQACTQRGLVTEGTLPGGLNVRRRAPALYQKLKARGAADPLSVMDWVNLYAIAVNEENAAGGRVVTAPTNGAAGVIPAVGQYYSNFVPGADQQGITRYLLAAAAIGVLYKQNASISGAEVGCQGEVGVACSMAAAGLVSALEGTNAQVEHAAEIGMEHNLGMTCDPVGGLVQIPCIERNAIGAVKAINAARMAMTDPGDHKVSLDQVIQTMYRTGMDMHTHYKETSLGGLALNVVEC